MELQPISRMLPVCQRHNLTVIVPCSHLQTGRKIGLPCNQRVITAAGYRLGQALKQRTGQIQVNLAGLSVHQHIGADNRSAKGLTDGLMSQANPQNRKSSAECANGFNGHAGILRISRTGRQNQCLRLHFRNFFHGDFIIAHYLNLRIQFSNILIQIVSEGIIVINH